jgi:hypothetical protein
MFLGERDLHHSLNCFVIIAFVALSVGLVLQPGKKWGIRSFGLGIAEKRLLKRWILVLGFFWPAPLSFEAKKTLVRYARG